MTHVIDKIVENIASYKDYLPNGICETTRIFLVNQCIFEELKFDRIQDLPFELLISEAEKKLPVYYDTFNIFLNECIHHIRESSKGAYLLDRVLVSEKVYNIIAKENNINLQGQKPIITMARSIRVILDDRLQNNMIIAIGKNKFDSKVDIYRGYLN